MIRTLDCITCSREEECNNCPIKNECDEMGYGTSSLNLWEIYKKALDDLTDYLQSDHSVHEEQLKHIRSIAEQLKKGKEE